MGSVANREGVRGGGSRLRPNFKRIVYFKRNTISNF